MTITIKQATYDEMPIIQKVARNSWHDTYEGIIPTDIQDKFLDESYSDMMMQKRIDQTILNVAVVDNDIIGFINMSKILDGNKSLLMAIYLLPEYQGQGLGSQLLNHSINELKMNANDFSIEVEVEKENTDAILFYESKGFEIVEKYTEDFYGHPLKTVKMIRKVTEELS